MKTMKRLDITKEAYNKSRYFKNKYGTLKYVSESGKVFKTSKGRLIRFTKESLESDASELERLAEMYYDRIIDGYNALVEFNERAAKLAPTCQNEIDDAIDNLDVVLHWLDVGSNGGFAAESAEVDGGSGDWFDSHGWLVGKIPEDCVGDCCHQGRCDDDVEYWVRELGFDKNFPSDKARKYIKTFGGWEDEKVDAMSDTELA